MFIWLTILKSRVSFLLLRNFKISNMSWLWLILLLMLLGSKRSSSIYQHQFKSLLHLNQIQHLTKLISASFYQQAYNTCISFPNLTLLMYWPFKTKHYDVTLFTCLSHAPSSCIQIMFYCLSCCCTVLHVQILYYTKY